MSDLEAEFAAWQEAYNQQQQPDEVDRGPSLGFGPPADVYAGQRVPPGTEIAGGLAGVVGQAPLPIYTDQVMDAILKMSEREQGAIAMEMFAFVPGAYRDIDTVFDGDELDLVEFSYALERTIELAARFGPEGFNFSGEENSQYLKLLMGDSERSSEEILAAFVAKRAEIEAARRGGGGGGGRVVNYIDPVALAAAAKDAFSSVTGRRATPTEQRDFVKQIHGLQASGATGIQVGPRAEAFAQSSAPVEAGAMEYARGAELLMQAIGL